ncbi:MAG: hypothetical protein GXY82_00630 [Methanospirillum sp.]|nr:hypothetical protein [Methanospirillum sp.]
MTEPITYPGEAGFIPPPAPEGAERFTKAIADVIAYEKLPPTTRSWVKSVDGDVAMVWILWPVSETPAPLRFRIEMLGDENLRWQWIP